MFHWKSSNVSSTQIAISRSTENVVLSVSVCSVCAGRGRRGDGKLTEREPGRCSPTLGWHTVLRVRAVIFPVNYSRHGTIFRCPDDCYGVKNGRTIICFTRIKLATGTIIIWYCNWRCWATSIIDIRLMLTVGEVYHLMERIFFSPVYCKIFIYHLWKESINTTLTLYENIIIFSHFTSYKNIFDLLYISILKNLKLRLVLCRLQIRFHNSML